MKTAFTFAAIALALSLAPLAACADGSALPQTSGCKSTTECTDGLTCSFNRCIVADPNPLELKVRITPPPPSGLLPQQIPSLSLTSGPDLLVRLIGPTVLRGGVKFTGDAFALNVPGSIDLRAEGDIPGLDFAFSAPSLSGVDRDGYGYSVRVLPGRRYVGTFRPEDPTLPRHVFAITPEEVATGRFDILLPAKADYRTFEGRVMRSDYTPIGSARVVVLTAAREVIGVASTEEVRGLFEVLMPPSVNEVFVKVESTATSKVFAEFVAGPFAIPHEGLVDLIVPDLPAGTEPITTVLRVLEQKVDAGFVPREVVPAVGRTVTIVGVFDGGALRRSGVTDQNGDVTFSLLPGAYECLVTSPPQSAAATWYGHINLGVVETEKVIPRSELLLSPRPPLIGRVTDAFGNPIESGRLTFERRVTWREGSSLVVAPAPFEVELGADGLYSTRVDPGIYDVTIAPDLETGAPNAFETEVHITEEGLRLDLGLPPPGLLHLTVADPEGAWLPGVRVELWADDDMGEPRLFGLGTTGPTGYVDLLVPHAGAGLLLALEHPPEPM